MSTFAIGDIQGCYKEFRKLLSEINFNTKKDTLWLTGDLVNKGPQSLDVIKYVMDLNDKAITVLGNHDFYLIASYFKADSWPNNANLFNDILSHKDSSEIIGWLRCQKIMHLDNELKHILVHAGIHPEWETTEILSLSSKIEFLLKGEHCKKFIESLWTNDPRYWSKNLDEKEKIIFAVNVFTRMRYLKKDLSLDFQEKLNPSSAKSSNLIPWYEFKSNAYKEYKTIIGHWSTLGFLETENLISIDTGCVWGNKMTAIKIEKNKNTKRYEIKC